MTWPARSAIALRGKDYCNCEHAQTLHRALEDILTEIAGPRKASTIDVVENMVIETLNEVDAARKEHGRLCEGCKG